MSELTTQSLLEMQQSMLKAITQPMQTDRIGFIDSQIAASSKLSAQAHFSIYQRSYILRLQQCMASQFSTLKYALGDDLFALFATQYLQTSPSSSYTLNTLGDRFPQFLQQTRPDAELEVKEDWPDFMIELATFEIALNQLFDAESTGLLADPLQIQATANTKDEQLQLVPILQLFQLSYPIIDYYRRYNDNQQPPLPLAKTSYAAVFRRNYRLGIIDLNASQYLFLKQLQQTQSINASKKQLIKQQRASTEAVDKLWARWRMYFIEMGIFNHHNLAE
ncbi:putative DNA-binding domain-containing protein [Shewanella sp. KX20019]|uniref:HvfC/BufC N-terminal domain-containing protein n=1 Tax=Shewanella sp. KX20019 TaxID=2803864 RepID=UPI0019281D62|nr:DNA-binding domain-containing protein [Shewanella sp. KX20019]QQX79615.1 putative DNA-binding domain-containing protein [Shewanella sp. KX20019]